MIEQISSRRLIGPGDGVHRTAGFDSRGTLAPSRVTPSIVPIWQSCLVPRWICTITLPRPSLASPATSLSSSLSLFVPVVSPPTAIHVVATHARSSSTQLDPPSPASVLTWVDVCVLLLSSEVASSRLIGLRDAHTPTSQILLPDPIRRRLASTYIRPSISDSTRLPIPNGT